MIELICQTLWEYIGYNSEILNRPSSSMVEYVPNERKFHYHSVSIKQDPSLVDIFKDTCFEMTSKNKLTAVSKYIILYSCGHLLITDAFCGNGFIKNLIENLFLGTPAYSGGRTHFLGPDGVRYREFLLYIYINDFNNW